MIMIFNCPICTELVSMLRNGTSKMARSLKLMASLIITDSKSYSSYVPILSGQLCAQMKIKRLWDCFRSN